MRIRLRRLQPILLGVAALGVLLYFVFESRGMGREEHARGEIALVKLRDALEDLERKVLVARNEPSRAAERLLEVDERVKTALAVVEKQSQGTGDDEFDGRLSALHKQLDVLSVHLESLGSSCTRYWTTLRDLPQMTTAVQQAGKLDADTAAALNEALCGLSLLQSSATSEPTEQMSA